jgi:hypothetical protein
MLRLNKKLCQALQELDFLYHCVEFHIQRSTDTNTLLTQQLAVRETFRSLSIIQLLQKPQ